MKFSLLTTNFIIEKKIDEFLDSISDAGLLFKMAIDNYLKNDMTEFEQKRSLLHDTENRGDSLRREVEEQLYSHTLIPESRGDVLELIENMDSLLDHYKAAAWRIDIEHPHICTEYHEDFRELVLCGIESVESCVCACRAFFKEIDLASEHMQNVIQWEKKSDVVSTRLQRAIFSNDQLKLSHKRHLRDFVRFMEKIADEAEDVVDRLSIYIIKRAL